MGVTQESHTDGLFLSACPTILYWDQRSVLVCSLVQAFLSPAGKHQHGLLLFLDERKGLRK